MNAGLHPVAPSSIRWLPAGSAAVELGCPVCGVTGRNVPLLDVDNLGGGSRLTLYTCSACDSRFFDPPGIIEFSEVLGKGEHFLKSYVEVIGGVWEMFWPAACAARNPAASLLDVGCGFGFTVDAWRRVRGDAVGVELAEYGRAGAEMLGVPIHADYLQNIPALQDRRFDVVYASEVIEHVPDPREFATLLSRYVAGDGVLSLTTPNAAYIREENAGPSVVAALCPGFHGFLISPRAMESILRDCGFDHVIVRPMNERLLAWASRQPLAIDEHSRPVREAYLAYLDDVLGTRSQDDFVTDGLAYRHFRDMVLAGRIDDARRSMERLQASLARKYGPDALHPDRMLARVRTLASPDDYSTAFPWFLPTWCFVRGLYAKLAERDEPSARAHFRASRELTTHIAATWGDLFVLEAISFLPDAWHQEAVSAALGADPSVCEAWLAAIGNGGPATAAAFCGSRPSNHHLEEAYLESLWILGALDRRAALGRVLEDCLDYLRGRYGDWTRAGPGGRERMPGAELQLEPQMLLQLKIAATCTLLGVHADLVRPLLETVIRLAGTQATPSAMSSRMVAEARSRLAALAPSFNQWGSPGGAMPQNISYTFTLGPKAKS